MALLSKLQLSAFFLFAVLSYFALSCEQEEYWQTKLPNVQMPQAIRDNLFHSSGKYEADNNPKVKAEDGVEPFTLHSNKKSSTNQPFTVFAWKYDVDNKFKDKDEDVVKPLTLDSNKKSGTNQPFTVVGWKYDADNKHKDKAEDVVDPLTLDSNKKADTNQPFTVFAWKYDVDNKFKDKDEDVVKPLTLDSNKKSGTNQPFTVVGWKYEYDNLKNKAGDVIKAPDMKETSNDHHHHHHLNKNTNSNQEDPNGGSLFFVEKSLHLGMILKHDFQKTPKIPFLPKHLAQTIPFKVEKIGDILNLFSLDSESTEGIAIKETLVVCLQRPKVKKENRTCAQSMEDVVDFVVGELGTNDVKVRMMKNNIEVPNGIQDYLVTKVKKLEVPNMNGVACHRMSYPYVVYYCHHQQDIGHYDVTLVSPTSGTRPIQTTAVCHYDTYAWQPDVPALRHLGIRPGDAPVCHFSAINDMFWSVKVGSKSFDMVQ